MKLFWRRIASLVLVAMLIAGGGINGPAPAYASAQSCAQNVYVMVDGRELQTDVPALIINGRTMVPLRFVAEAMGASVSWNGATKTVTVIPSPTQQTGVREIRLQIGNPEPGVEFRDGVVKTFLLDVPAQLIRDRTMVPLRFVSEMMGALVTWDGPPCIVRIAPGKGGIGGFGPPLLLEESVSAPEESRFKTRAEIEEAVRLLVSYLGNQGMDAVVVWDLGPKAIGIFEVSADLGPDTIDAATSAIEDVERFVAPISHPLTVRIGKKQRFLPEGDAFMSRHLYGSVSTPADMALGWERRTGWAALQAVAAEKRDPMRVFTTVSHETTHIIQDQAVVSVGMGRQGEPDWITEGVATFVAMTLTARKGYRGGIFPYEKIRATMVKSAQRGTTPLAGYEKTVEKDRGYDTAGLAAEYLQHLLIQSGRASGLLDFSWIEEHWKAIGREGFDRAFIELVGITRQAFYEAFRVHADAGYPELFPDG